MGAKNLEHMAGFYLAPGYSTEYMHVFWASDLYPSPLPGDPDERIEIVKIPIAQIKQSIENGDIQVFQVAFSAFPGTKAFDPMTS